MMRKVRRVTRRRASFIFWYQFTNENNNMLEYRGSLVPFDKYHTARRKETTRERFFLRQLLLLNVAKNVIKMKLKHK